MTALERVAAWYSRRRFGRVLGPVRVTARHGRLLVGYGAFETALERSHLVDAKLKDLGVMKAAAMVGCEFCIDFGSWEGRANGVTDQQLRDLPRFRESPAFSPLEKLALEYAEVMTRTPAETPPELVRELRCHLDEPQLVELTAAIGIENYRARFNHAFGLGSEGFSEGSVCAVPERAGAAAETSEA